MNHPRTPTQAEFRLTGSARPAMEAPTAHFSRVAHDTGTNSRYPNALARSARRRTGLLPARHGPTEPAVSTLGEGRARFGRRNSGRPRAGRPRPGPAGPRRPGVDAYGIQGVPLPPGHPQLPVCLGPESGVKGGAEPHREATFPERSGGDALDAGRRPAHSGEGWPGGSPNDTASPFAPPPDTGSHQRRPPPPHRTPDTGPHAHHVPAPPHTPDNPRPAEPRRCQTRRIP